jgi:hypothetical protein
MAGHDVCHARFVECGEIVGIVQSPENDLSSQHPAIVAARARIHPISPDIRATVVTRVIVVDNIGVMSEMYGERLSRVQDFASPWHSLNSPAAPGRQVWASLRPAHHLTRPLCYRLPHPAAVFS